MTQAKGIEALLTDVKACRICEEFLPHGCRPVVHLSASGKIAVIGQAPGRKVHESGIPWDDASGNNLRSWMGVTKEQFYNDGLFAIVPMGFCFPGTGTSGDLPPRKECAPTWHAPLFEQVKGLQLTLLIGQYAQAYYLKGRQKNTLTETVRHFEDYLPDFFVLPHPSPRNNIWKKKNPWFEVEVLPSLREQVHSLINARTS